MDISNLTVVALGRGLKSYEGLKLAAGSYPVDDQVRGVGTLKVGESHEARVANAIPWQQLCCLLLDKLNSQTAQSTTDDVIAGFLSGALKEDLKQRAEQLKPRGQSCLDRILGVTKRQVSGAVTGQIVLIPVRADVQVTHLTEASVVASEFELQDAISGYEQR